MSPRWGSTPRLTDWPTVSRNSTLTWLYPCLGGFECLHRDRGRRRRQREGKHQVWGSKIWSRKTRLARASSIYKRHTRPLIREGAPENKTVTVKSNEYLVMSPRWGSTPRLTDWLTVSRNVTLTLTLTPVVSTFSSCVERTVQGNWETSAECSAVVTGRIQ
jgi:hypothetical protein